MNGKGYLRIRFEDILESGPQPSALCSIKPDRQPIKEFEMLNCFAEQIITGTGSSPLDSLVEQLWKSPIESGDIRVVTNARRNNEWRDVERYWVLPSIAHPRMLIPRGSRRVTAAALLSYRAIRPIKTRIGRSGLGWAAACGLPPSLGMLSVQRRSNRSAAQALPLSEISGRLGAGPIVAAIGIRLGDNRKPTLQLFDQRGGAVGYAKLAWNEPSRGFIETERDTMASLAGGSEHMRVPKLLGEGTWDGYPFLVSTPLPKDVRAVRGHVDPPSPQELFSLCDVHRQGPVSGTAHFTALGRRLALMPDNSVQNLRQSTNTVYRLLLERNQCVPVSRIWHGDMAPWNVARDRSGLLWCWDWETSEADAVAGLDAWHWAVSVRREARGSFSRSDWIAAGALARPYLEAAAIPRSAWPDVAAIYALVVVERAWNLANVNGDWTSSWLSPENLIAVLDTVSEDLA